MWLSERVKALAGQPAGLSSCKDGRREPSAQILIATAPLDTHTHPINLK